MQAKIGKIDQYILDLVGNAIRIQGNWDASTNNPDITGTTVTGNAWIISVEGSTDLGGITDWKVGDMAVLTATGWIKVDNTEPDLSIFVKKDQTTDPQVITATDTTITASDEVYFGDVTDSTKLKKDTVQGILDLVPATDLSDYIKKDGSVAFTSEANVLITVTAGEAISAGDICYIKSSSGTAMAFKAKGDAEATIKGRIVLAPSAVSSGASGTFLVRGYYKDSGLTVAATYFISTSTAGAKVTTAPSSGNFLRVIGWAMSDTSFYFDPSKDYIEVS